jgi:hypothetical protein
MPFKSEKQRRFLWANEPEVASRWSKKERKAKDNVSRPSAKMSALAILAGK